MKLIILVLMSLSLVGVVISTPLNDFDSYLTQYKKSYVNPLEQKRRKAIFESNLKKIDEYNRWAESNNLDSRLGLTNFTDLEYAEFVKQYTGYVPSNAMYPNLKTVSVVNTPKATIPDAWDWRAQGKVNPIQDQKKCGCCWAFSIVSIAEIAHAIKYNTLLKLSEQELVDCVSKNNGCSGGDPINAAAIVLGSGLMLDSNYPYQEKKNQYCYFNSAKVAAKPTYGYKWVGTEANLKTVVSQTGPVAIAIYASSTLQNFKSSGVFADPACVGITRESQVNHAVSIVGYGTQNGQDYWLVRNQWGTSWGDNGYVKLPRGSNYCGIRIQPIFFSY